MNHKQQHTLEAIFGDHISGNLHWREVESLLHALGAEIREPRGASLHVILNGIEGALHRPHHSGVLTKDEVRHLRKFLLGSGVKLGD